MTVHVLVTARQRSAAANLAHVIDEARASLAFGPDLDFDAMIWALPRDRGRHPSMNNARALYFSRNPPDGKRTYVHHTKRAEADSPLAQPFGDFMKAYVRLADANKARKMLGDYGNMIRAGRWLHDVMEPKGHDPCRLTTDDFASAFAAFEAGGPKDAARYAMGSHLSRLASFVTRRGIALAPIDFPNPVSGKVLAGHRRGGADVEAARAAKLPSDAVLDALADIASRVENDTDVVLMRTIELMVCAPWRIHEVLAMPADCEVTRELTEKGEPLIDAFGKPVVGYGLRYHGGKGHGWDIKWIPTAMVDVAKRAVADLRRITEPSRAVARWLAAHPGRAWVPEPWTGANPDMILGTNEVSLIVKGEKDPIAGRDFIVKNGLPHRRFGAAYEVRLGDVEAELLSRMGEISEGHEGVRREDHLLILPAGFFGTRWLRRPTVVRFLAYYEIQNCLTGRANVASIFERFGHVDAEGVPLRMTSHALRHWLNTLAQDGGASQVDIARWSGRKTVEQNAAYNHLSGVALAEKARALMEVGSVKGAIADMADRLPPVDRADFLKAGISTAHTTDLGMCVNDWSLAPCHHHGSCADCCDHLVVKGDATQRSRAETLLAETDFLLGKAREEMAEESFGASNWVAHQERMQAGLKAVLAVHDDPAVADGTLVQANPRGALRGPLRMLGEADPT
ncbi:hypothetical protein [Methylobacterium fujisawaense]|uniref:hypothetical protein n=1 Tax=Methylobacterium fujisawaense TaxID=107400 RepID=UPI0036FA59DD